MAERRPDKFALDVAELLAMANEAERVTILGVAEQAFAAEACREASATFRAILGREVVALTDRMRALRTSQYWHLPRSLGNSACKLEVDRHPKTSRRTLRTPLMLGPEPELVDGARMTTGYMFSVPARQGSRGAERVEIGRYLVHEHVEERRRQGGYSILFTRGRRDTVSDLRVRGDEFDDYWKLARKAAEDQRAAFLYKHPEFPADFGTRAKRQLALVEPFTQISQEIQRLKDGPPEYPDQLYQFPAGLVIQARRELER